MYWSIYQRKIFQRLLKIFFHLQQIMFFYQFPLKTKLLLPNGDNDHVNVKPKEWCDEKPKSKNNFTVKYT